MSLNRAVNLSRPCLFPALLLAALMPLTARAADTNGIFAAFDTSMGSFTCRVDYAEVPMIAANFVGLAEGSRSWLDLDTGRIRNDPFYDGLTFHRVVSGFVIQTGSRAGDGSDGPGYTFPDQFDPALNHSQTGTLSMANSGYGSNGSQFFITLAPTPSLDDHHSVFGQVVSGLDVVAAIGTVPVGAGSKPLVDVVIYSVTILRCGPAAEAFDVNAHGLPDVEPVDIELVQAGPEFALAFPREIYSEYFLYHSPDLLSPWTNASIGLYFDPPPTGNVVVTDTTLLSDERFYTVPSVDYVGPLFTPPSNANGTFVFAVDGVGSVTNVYDALGGGTYSSVFLGSGAIAGSLWLRDPYRGRLIVDYPSPTANWDMSLVYLMPTTGVFNATVLSTSPFKITGTFTSAFP